MMAAGFAKSHYSLYVSTILFYFSTLGAPFNESQLPPLRSSQDGVTTATLATLVRRNISLIEM